MSTDGDPIMRWDPTACAENELYNSRLPTHDDDPILPKEPVLYRISRKALLHAYTLPGPVQPGEATERQHLAGNVSVYMESGRGPRPVVDCLVCYERLLVPGLQEPGNTDPGIELLPLHQLRCDHVLCKGCLAQYVRTQLRDHGRG